MVIKLAGMELKLVLIWILGSMLMVAGAWVAGNLELTVGVSMVSYAIAVLASFVLVMLASLCWIAVAVAARH